MSATKITVIGNVVNSPSRVRLQNGSVTNFRMAANERWFDSAAQAFVDGASFFVDVECWGELGGHVSQSISKGDPVIVVGNMRTHEWESDQGRRSRPQIKAEAVGPNLAKGTADFARVQRAQAAAPAEDTAPAGADLGSVDDLVRGRDYDDAPETLHQSDTPDLAREPAHV
ncbi:single-stranded DNA-binding protein [Geodermatophilus sp. DF01-2]|uniref:single-stranded DNA-binding protein n=1 Tax=Geodermatophilus sp. DF01-2 TaxID=2559610 RepID=UPI001072F921|nr:single-stranded DNA-binding protein [Geodermatophilus sp. DF01_2]TFV54821.1 single-stranded DNA-binding protein [Geodermatophilus sp. DF01_2]